jgi:hypothetical protein
MNSRSWAKWFSGANLLVRVKTWFMHALQRNELAPARNLEANRLGVLP